MVRACACASLSEGGSQGAGGLVRRHVVVQAVHGASVPDGVVWQAQEVTRVTKRQGDVWWGASNITQRGGGGRASHKALQNPLARRAIASAGVCACVQWVSTARWVGGGGSRFLHVPRGTPPAPSTSRKPNARVGLRSQAGGDVAHGAHDVSEYKRACDHGQRRHKALQISLGGLHNAATTAPRHHHSTIVTRRQPHDAMIAMWGAGMHATTYHVPVPYSGDCHAGPVQGH